MNIFGVAGVPTNYKGKFKDLFNWLREMGLNAYEIQCVYGFKIFFFSRIYLCKDGIAWSMQEIRF